MLVVKRHNPKRFGKSAVGGGIRLYQGAEATVNKTERFASFVAPDKGFPSCGSQNSLRLGAPMNFDRCAILASLHPPLVAFRRRCLRALSGHEADNQIKTSHENKTQSRYPTKFVLLTKNIYLCCIIKQI